MNKSKTNHSIEKRPNYALRRAAVLGVLALSAFGVAKGAEALKSNIDRPIQELSQIYKNGDRVTIIKDMVLDGTGIPKGQSVNIEKIMPYLDDSGRIVNDPVGTLNSGDKITSSYAIDIQNGPILQDANGIAQPQELYLFHGDVNGENGWYYVDVSAMSEVDAFAYSSSINSGVISGNNNVTVDGKKLGLPITTFTTSSKDIK